MMAGTIIANPTQHPIPKYIASKLAQPIGLPVIVPPKRAMNNIMITRISSASFMIPGTERKNVVRSVILIFVSLEGFTRV